MEPFPASPRMLCPALQVLCRYNLAKPFAFFTQARSQLQTQDVHQVEDADLERAAASDPGHALVLQLARTGVARRCYVLSGAHSSDNGGGGGVGVGVGNEHAGAGIHTRSDAFVRVPVGADTVSIVVVGEDGSVEPQALVVAELWRRLHSDVSVVVSSALSWVARSFADRCLLHSALLAGQVEVAGELLHHTVDRLPQAVTERIVLAAARDIFNSSASAEREALAAATATLGLLGTHNPSSDVRAERQLVEATILQHTLGGACVSLMKGGVCGCVCLRCMFSFRVSDCGVVCSGVFVRACACACALLVCGDDGRQAPCCPWRSACLVVMPWQWCDTSSRTTRPHTTSRLPTPTHPSLLSSYRANEAVPNATVPTRWVAAVVQCVTAMAPTCWLTPTR